MSIEIIYNDHAFLKQKKSNNNLCSYEKVSIFHSFMYGNSSQDGPTTAYHTQRTTFIFSWYKLHRHSWKLNLGRNRWSHRIIDICH